MAKKSVTRTIGAVQLKKDGSRVIKINSDVVLKQGQYVNLETPSAQIEGLTRAMQEGKLTEEWAMKQIERLEKTPDFVTHMLTTKVEVEV